MQDFIKRLKIDKNLKRVISMHYYKTPYCDLHPHDRVLRVNAEAKKVLYYLRKIEKMEGKNE